MKKILLALAFIGCMFAAHAQEKPSTGDLYDGLTRPLTFNRVIPPYALEVTFSKTVHVIFPSAIRYVDLGSSDLLAAKADGTERCVGRGAAAPERRNPLSLTGGYKSDKIGELRKTLNKINQKRR